MSDSEYSKCLRDKLLEEAEEVKDTSNSQDMLEEIADVLEVLDVLCELHNISKQDVEKRKQKNDR